MRRLRTRLLILVLLAGSPAIGAIAYYGYRDQTIAYAQARANAAQLARTVAANFRRSAIQTRNLVSTLAEVPAILSGPTPVCESFARRILRQNPALSNIGVIDRRGYLACSAKHFDSRVYLGDRSYFRQAGSQRDLATGTFQIGRVVHVPVMVFAAPLGADATDGRYVVYASLGLTGLSDIARASLLPAGSSMSVLDSSRRVIAHYPHPRQWLGKHVRSLTALTRSLRPGETKIAQVTGAGGGEQMFSVYATNGARGDPSVYVAVGVPRAGIVVPGRVAMAASLGILGIVTVLLLGIAWWGGNRLILRRVDILVDAARRLGAGQRGIRARLQGRDELALLGGAFDDMAESLEFHRDSLEEQIDRSNRLNLVYRVLSGINGVILRVRDRDTLLAEACRIAVEVGYHPMAWIGLVDEPTGAVRMAAHAGASREMIERLYVSTDGDVPEGRGTIGTALRSRQPCICNDIRSDPRMAPWRDRLVESHCLSVASFPLVLKERAIGNFTLYADRTDFFDPDEIRLYQEVVANTVIGLELIETGEERDYLADFDPATGLQNRRRFLGTLERTLRLLPPGTAKLSILAVKVPELARITDHFGQHVGDEIRRKVAVELASLLDVADTLAALDSDLFGIAILDGGPDGGGVDSLARHILDLCSLEVEIDGQRHLLTARAGAAAGDGEPDVDNLLREAEVAVNALDGSARKFQFYSRQDDARELRRYQLYQGLRDAISNDEFEVLYQPYVYAESERYAGAEALLRWTSPRLGPVSPGEFIPVAEETGLITEIGAWVFRTVLAQIEAWQAADVELRAISVNVSAAEFQQPDIADLVERQVAASGADLTRCAVALELTETAVVQDFEHVSTVLRRIRSMGLKTYLDDYGTGYSSLLYLQRAPLDALKIDLSFIRRIVEDATSRALTRSSISLAHSLDLQVIAEGVEDREQLEILRELDCDIVQGYLFSRPVDLAGLLEFIAAHQG